MDGPLMTFKAKLNGAAGRYQSRSVHMLVFLARDYFGYSLFAGDRAIKERC
jgi:hypothetical protein